MKTWIIIILLIFVILNSPVTAQNKYIIKIATYAPGKSLWMKTMHKLSADVLRKTDGKLKIIFYPDVIFKSDKTAIGYMKSGKLQGAALTGVGLGMVDSQFRIFEIPFLFSNRQELQKTEENLSSILSKRLKEKHYILLGRCDQGFAYMMSDYKITTADDFKKATIWVWKQDKLAYQIFSQLFKKVVPLEVKQVKSFLKFKKLDTVIMPVVPIIYLGWYHQLKYFIDVPIANVLWYCNK